MTVQKKSRRGFTLLELSIVIALVAIAVVMVSTFCIVTDHRVRESRRSLAVTNDIAVTETIAEGWIELFLSQGADFSVEDQTLIAHVGEDSYKLSFALSEDKKERSVSFAVKYRQKILLKLNAILILPLL